MESDDPKQKELGFIVPPILAVGIVGLTRLILEKYDGGSGVGGIFVLSEFVIVPALMGMMSAWFWRGFELSNKKLNIYALYITGIAIGLSFLCLGEGMICLVIVSPLIVCFTIGGVFLGRAMFNRNNKTLNVSIIGLLLFIFIGDALSKHEYQNEVTDTLIINATPAQIWKNVVAFKRIEKKPEYWLFRMELPSPVESTVDGYYVGAGRKCIFSNGYTFGEKIVVYDENKDLTFDITNQPRDPEIMNHIDLVRGQFLLKDNGNGTTTLIGNSWYKLYVFPTWYYDSWAQSIVRNVHLRVMQHIKELSENAR